MRVATHGTGLLQPPVTVVAQSSLVMVGLTDVTPCAESPGAST